MNITIYTSDEEITKALNGGFKLKFDCNLASWAWGAYELMGLVNRINDCPQNTILAYLWSNYRLRIEKDLRNVIQLKNNMQRLRTYLREECNDILICLANRIFKYDDALLKIYHYYRTYLELNAEDLAKLSLAAYRYGLISMSIEVLRRIIEMRRNDLVYLALVSMLNPQWWPSHLSIDTGVLKVLNWLFLLFNTHYIIMMVNLDHNYVVSDLNVNINGSRLVNDNYYDMIIYGDTYIFYHVISRSGHGVVFMGNWGDDPVSMSINYTFNEGSVKGRFIDVNVKQWLPSLVLPHDYVSIKY